MAANTDDLREIKSPFVSNIETQSGGSTLRHKNACEGDLKCRRRVMGDAAQTDRRLSARTNVQYLIWWVGTVALPSMDIWVPPRLCATPLAAFACRLRPNPVMGLQHSTHFSYRQTNAR